MILTEAMAAGTPVVASDLDAFRRVLEYGRAGALFPVGDAVTLAARLVELLDNPLRRAGLVTEATHAVAVYDWPVVAARVLEVYNLAVEASPRRATVRSRRAPARSRPE
jgi:phosphatidylinositol alpha-mannosyltransferase